MPQPKVSEHCICQGPSNCGQRFQFRGNGNHGRWNDLHEASQHRQIHLMIIEQAVHLLEGRSLRLMREIDVMKRNLVPIGVFPHFRVICDDASDVAVKLSASPALEHIDKSMRRFGGEQRDLGSCRYGRDSDVQPQFLSHASKPF